MQKSPKTHRKVSTYAWYSVLCSNLVVHGLEILNSVIQAEEDLYNGWASRYFLTVEGKLFCDALLFILMGIIDWLMDRMLEMELEPRYPSIASCPFSIGRRIASRLMDSRSPLQILPVFNGYTLVDGLWSFRELFYSNYMYCVNFCTN